MVYKLKITKTYYTVRRGTRTYKYVKLIVNLPLDEKLLNVDYVYVLTPEEYETLVRDLSKESSIKVYQENVDKIQTENDLCEKVLSSIRCMFAGKKYVKLENVLKVLSEAGINVTREKLEECGIEVVNKGKEKGYYVKIPT